MKRKRARARERPGNIVDFKVDGGRLIVRTEDGRLYQQFLVRGFQIWDEIRAPSRAVLRESQMTIQCLIERPNL